MAKYLGLISTDARGKLGGLVHTRAVSGTTHRAKVSGVNPASPAQQQARQRFARALALWREQSFSVQLAWISLASAVTWTNTLGAPYSPSGQQLFVQCTRNFLSLGVDGAPSPPAAPPAVQTPNSLMITKTGTTLTVSYSVPAGSFTPLVAFWLGPPQSLGARYATKGICRFIGTQQFPYSDFDITTEFQNLWGRAPTKCVIRLYAQCWTPFGWPGSLASSLSPMS